MASFESNFVEFFHEGKLLEHVNTDIGQNGSREITVFLGGERRYPIVFSISIVNDSL